MPEPPEAMNGINELYKIKNLNHRGHKGTQRKAFLVLNLAAPCLTITPQHQDIPSLARINKTNNGFTSVYLCVLCGSKHNHTAGNHQQRKHLIPAYANLQLTRYDA